MEARYDIKIEKKFINANNDLEWYASDQQHIKDTIEAAPGSYKENPADGVAINTFLNSQGQEAEIAQKITIELAKDLYICNSPKVSYDNNGKLIIDANL